MSFRRFIQHNFWLKLISLLLAIAIWFIIKPWVEESPPLARMPVMDLARRESMPVRVEVMKQAVDSRVFAIDPEQVQISITGEAAVLNELRWRDVKAYIDLTDPQRPLGSLRVRIHAPLGVSILDVTPMAVNVEQISP